MISVLCPSRARPELLARSIESLQSTASSAWLIEYLVVIDSDDPLRERYRKCAPPGVKLITSMMRYGYGDLGKYYNMLADYAVGSWLLLWNDDAIMITPGWNKMIEELPETTLVADLHTDMSPAVCAFPAVRDVAVRKVGYFCPKETSHTDSYWQDVGRITGTIRPVPAHVVHDRFDLTGNNDDGTYRESRGQYRSEEYYGPVVQARIRTDAERLVP